VHHSLRAAALLAALCFSIVLSGCGSSGEAEDPAPANDSPLAEFMSSAYESGMSQEEQEKEYAERERKREDLVAQCMTEEGFEYTPNVQDVSFSMGTETEWNPDSREWVSQYGYGMINYPGRDDEPVASEQEYVDPNADYVSSLSESERTAFYEALHGPTPDEEDMPAEGEMVEWDWTTAGCYGWSENEINGDDADTTEKHQPLIDSMNTLYEDMMSSPELTEADAEWSSCMADAGHPGFTAQLDAQNSINEKMNSAYDGMSAGSSATAEAVEPGAMVEPDMDGLAEEEIAIALADLDCREKTNYRDTMESVQFELEQQFIDDHKAELEAFRADIEQGN